MGENNWEFDTSSVNWFMNTTYTTKVRAYDALNNKNEISCSIIYTNSSKPNPPSNPEPSLLAETVLITPILSWICGDPDNGDTLTYDLYLSTDESPSLFISGITSPSFSVNSNLSNCTKYYWKIIAADSLGLVTNGPVWSFTTDGDCDLDNMLDSWELDHFSNLDNDGTLDTDSDGLTDLEEYVNLTNPTKQDSDNDFMSDYWEVNNNLNPILYDSNLDADNDKFTNGREFQDKTDPRDNNSYLILPEITGRISDTMQDSSYSDSYGEDSDYMINSSTFIKMDSSGNYLSDNETEWSMVLDIITGYIWEVKTDDASIHDKDNSYVYQGAKDEFILSLNISQFGGFNDWRLPSINELYSIVSSKNNNPTINQNYFPSIKSSSYWSSDKKVNNETYAWGVKFNTGESYVSPISISMNVIAVRGNSICSQDNMIYNDEQTIVDTNTGLMWQTQVIKKTWDEALAYCEHLDYAGFTDWRLPNIKEVRSIFNFKAGKPEINLVDSSDIENPDRILSIQITDCMWSSSTNPDLTENTKVMSLYDGNDYNYNKSETHYVCAVRGGQNNIPLELMGELAGEYSCKFRILSPKMAENLFVGSSKIITWDANAYTGDISGNVKILLSRDAGKPATFEVITESTDNSGSYLWEVTGPISSKCTIKIIPVTEPLTSTVKETMQGLFTIKSSNQCTAAVSNTPPVLTNLNNISIQVGGGDVISYKYKLNDNDFSETKPISSLIELINLQGGMHTLFILGRNAAGTWQEDELPTIVTWEIDAAKPDAPSSINLDFKDDTGFSNNDYVTNKTSDLSIRGTGENNATVKFYDNAVLIEGADGVVSNGVFEIPISLNHGEHIIIAKQIDLAGNISDSSSHIKIIVDTIIPQSPGDLNLDEQDDTGESNSDNITKNSSGLTITGSGELGALIELYEEIDSNLIKIPDAFGYVFEYEGSYIFSINISLLPGTHKINAVQQDVAGNISNKSTDLSIIVDDVAPLQSSALDLDEQDDTGESNSDNITNIVSSLFISGTGEVGAKIKVYDNGVFIDDTMAIVELNTSFSIDISLEGDGIHNITVNQTDTAGNISEYSPVLPVIIDTIAPNTNTSIDGDKCDSDQTVKIECIDDSGCQSTFFTLDGNNPNLDSQVYSTEFFITNDTEIRFFSVDKAGNIETIKSETYIIDKINPVASITNPEDQSAVNQLYEINIEATDQGTNIDRVEIVITDGIFYINSEKEFVTSLSWVITEKQLNNLWSFNTSSVNWAEETEYTITAKAFDEVGHFSEDSIRFVFGQLALPSIITCEPDKNSIILGELVQITGKINPTPEDANFVNVLLTGPDGHEVLDAVISNSEGEYLYNLKCSDINMDGSWKLQTSWSGNDRFERAFSDEKSVDVIKAGTKITADAGSLVIKHGESIDITGKLTTTPNCGLDLTGTPINLWIWGAGQHKYEIVNTNSLGQFILDDFTGFNALGQWSVQAVFLENNAYKDSHSEEIIVSVVETAGYAIIVGGRIENSEGVDSHTKTCDFVYKQLIDRGLIDTDIFYLNFDDTKPNVDAKPSNSKVQEVITVWARDKINENPANLYIIMIDHGLVDTFYIYPDEISSSDLASWLDTLQAGLEFQAIDQEILLLLGYCRSGSFINEVSGTNRIVITSAAENESSYKGPLDPNDSSGIRDGEFFITEFFRSVALGKDVLTCFKTANNKTTLFTSTGTGSPNGSYTNDARQHPLLNDNGDSIGNNNPYDENGIDGYLSSSLIIGVSSATENAAGDVQVSLTSESQILDTIDNTTSFWAKVTEKDRVRSIWLEIKNPDFTPEEQASEQIEMDLAHFSTIDYNTDFQRFEWDEVGGFTEPGTYQIFFFARDDNSENISTLK